MLLATASQAALERSSRGRMTTWLRTPMRPFSRRQPQNFRLECPFVFPFACAMASPHRLSFGGRAKARSPEPMIAFKWSCQAAGSGPSPPASARLTSPTLGFHVVDVDVLALADVGDRLADVLPVFPDRVAGLDVVQGGLVADRDIVLRGQDRKSTRLNSSH